MNNITKIIPSNMESLPEIIFSLPRLGPTVLSSTIVIGALSDPDLKSIAKSFASWRSRPVI